MTVEEEIKDYCIRRDKAVMGSLQDFKHFAEKEGKPFPNDKIAEISYHKCRTAILSLPKNIRDASDKWLKEHNYTSWM